MELDEKVKILQEELRSLSSVHVKSAISISHGDLSMARKQLQQVRQITSNLNAMGIVPSGVLRDSSPDSATVGSGNDAGNPFSLSADSGRVTDFGSSESRDSAGSSSSLKAKREEITAATTAEKKEMVVVKNKNVPCTYQKQADLKKTSPLTNPFKTTFTDASDQGELPGSASNRGRVLSPGMKKDGNAEARNQLLSRIKGDTLPDVISNNNKYRFQSVGAKKVIVQSGSDRCVVVRGHTERLP